MTTKNADPIRTQAVKLVAEGQLRAAQENAPRAIALALVYIGDALHKLANAPNVQVHLNIHADPNQPLETVTDTIMRAVGKNVGPGPGGEGTWPD